MSATLADFARRSASADAAVLYSTGHSVEVGGKLYLLPGDYPASEKRAALARRAHKVSELAQAARARKANLIFHAGCRDDPFD